MPKCRKCSDELVVGENCPPSWIKHRQFICRPCRKQQRRDTKIKAVEHLGGKCKDCEGVFPEAVYDFHHLDPTEKEAGMASLTSDKGWSKILEELDKCVLLCANCHRIRHYKENEDE